VFFHHRREAVFKFGASDYSFQRLRPNNLVIWEAIGHYASNGFTILHLGRTSLANTGLRRFKRGFGGDEELIEYYKYDLRKQSFVCDFDYSEGPVSRVFRWLTLPALRMSGRLLYPHLG
jgi:lipid II:glycine glycyltransferase (peptidoglycan interpeptide bridge formation enzyme)